MNSLRYIGKFISTLLVVFLLCNTLFVFIYKYTYPEGILSLSFVFDANADSNIHFYRLNFYISMGLFCLSLLICIYVSNFFSRAFSIFFSFASCVIGTYALNDVFSINLCMYIAYLIAISASFKPKKGIIISSVSIILFLYFLYRPEFLGVFPSDFTGTQPDTTIILPIVSILLFVMICTNIINLLSDKFSNSQNTIEYLTVTEKQLVLFNNQLQQLAKKRGRVMVKQDRLRFTRDLHDTCGYAFSNIILTTDAAVSQNEMDSDNIQEIFHKIRNLASKGLQETREILHFIRKTKMPYYNTIDTISQIKSIFEDVTGIKVDVVWGNINHDYNSKINNTITRLIQEAFTNSIRHGQASFIQIHFYESNGELVIMIKDNGKGSSSIVKGIGLAGMEERLDLVQGKLSFSAPPEGGFRLTAVIPIKKGSAYERTKN